MIRILSYGGGVQSEAIARMSLDGALPKLDHIIFADTGAEWPETYETAERLEMGCHNHGVKFHRVKCYFERSTGSIIEDMLRDTPTNRWSMPPVYIADTPGQPTGQTKRQCTGDFKKSPIERCIKQEVLGLSERAHWPKEPAYELWLGISWDESQRMKASQRPAELIYHPLIEEPQASPIGSYALRKRPLHRSDAAAWLHANGYVVPVKSACAICPYASRRRWRTLARNHPHEFELACAVDDNMRRVSSFKGVPYLHRDGIPLRDIDLREPDQITGQGSLIDDDVDFSDECAGMCGT